MGTYNWTGEEYDENWTLEQLEQAQSQLVDPFLLRRDDEKTKLSLVDYLAGRFDKPQTTIDTAAFRSRSRSAQPLEVHSMLIECLDELDRLCK